VQVAVWELFHSTGEEGAGLLLRAPTGSGKTEAVGVPALALGRRLIMIYPTRSLVDDQIGRFAAMLQRLSALRPGKPVALTIDTGATSLRRIWVNGAEQRPEGNSRRHLYQGDVIITTLDKFLYRFFAYGEPKKSYIFPLRIHYGLQQALICFDEAHSYDDVAFTNFTHLVEMLYRRGRDLVLMTATLPDAKRTGYLDFLDLVDFTLDDHNRQALNDYQRVHFPERNFPARTLHLVPAAVASLPDDAGELVPALVREAVARMGLQRRVIVLAERVADAVLVWRALKGLADADLAVWLYHGRLTDARRKLVYDQLKQAEIHDQGYLLVTTSAIEVGCDLDAHALITQLCDPDRLIQRAGRCNRRQKMADAQVVVVGDTIPAWLTALSEDEQEEYRAALERQMGKAFDPAPLLACLRTSPSIDYRVEMMFDMLYEYVYEGRLENEPLHDKGFIITRSWEPSLTLCTALEAGDRPANAVSVPMRSCRAAGDESLSAGWSVGKLAYDQSEERFRWMDLRAWECAYSADVIAYPNVTLHDFDEEVGWVELPKLFNQSFNAGYRRVLVRKDDEQGYRLWYIAALKEVGERRTAAVEEQEAGEPEGDAEDE
jgi:CRISPR-associated endonuclease/helicase Cas3